MNRRLDRIEREIRQRVATLWDHFTNKEIEAIAKGDLKALAEFDIMGYDELLAFNNGILTLKERAELEQLEKELQEQS